MKFMVEAIGEEALWSDAHLVLRINVHNTFQVKKRSLRVNLFKILL